jgi:DNA polymerase-3 subunit alpha (Gram-positive type)
MGKSFSDVFCELRLTEDMQTFLKDVSVSRVTTNREHTRLRVYMESPHLIDKMRIFQLQDLISRQLFHKKMEVTIIEKFHLSAQYNLKFLVNAYWDSIKTEIRNYSKVLYTVIRKARLEFPEDGAMELELEDTIPARQHEAELCRILEKIFCERCGLDARLHIQYREHENSRTLQNAEIQLKNKIHLISQRAQGNVPDALPAAGRIADPAATETGAKEKDAVLASPNAKEAKPSASSFKGKRSFGNNTRRNGWNPMETGDPNLVYGRDFEGEAVEMSQVDESMGDVILRGKILSFDMRDTRKGERKMVIFTFTDFTDTFTVKMFPKVEWADVFSKRVKKGGFYKLKGVASIDRFDGELSISSVSGIRKIPDFTSNRMDTSPVKRVELHCHTKMSDMDGVSEVGDIIARAASWGHPAIAVTDHGDVQAFPDANHAMDQVPEDFKVIYGMEAYLVDDLKGLVTNPAGQNFQDSFVVFDLETTGLSASACRIIEIGAVKIEQGKITDRFSTFVNPQEPIPYHIEQLTSINDAMVMDAPVIRQALPEFMEFCDGCMMVAHNADFDMGFIQRNCAEQGIACEKTILDTVMLARYLLPQLNRFKLDTVAKALKVSLDHHHRAVDDAECTAEIFLKMAEMLQGRGIHTMEDLAAAGRSDENLIRKLPSYHAIFLAQNDIGRVNLYRLVSDSHLHYFNKRPLVPKSELNRWREGILVGSACEAGELYQALLSGASDEEIARIVRFYDYLEIQPTGNNAFMILSDRYPVYSEKDIEDLNRRIVRLGREFNKLVAATCDVHFLDPEDEIYRRIIMAGKGFKDADSQAPLYLRTTEEMLAEFRYLGSDLAEEVVITNTRKIADMIEKISPVRPDKCPPVIPDSDRTLREICYNRAHEIYGETLPDVVTERLERELNSIISNGFAVMYIIAQKLVWKSNEDGYLVGSRGSVGSSFVATMAGITEVNPLSPHYLCPKCHYVDFDSPEVKAYAGRAGCDMPDRTCPVCGERLDKLGFDIPFETFLGFKGNKEPDIDLNFSGDYQSKAHKYTEVIFGDGQTFRAGTIGTLADKTAFGYVKNYYEERGVRKRNCEIDRIVQGCVNVRRTTGQHPGGIIVLPLGENIYSFTPIQHPANDMTTDIITTHFDYHSIDHNLLKLDILGHDDPTMIRMLQDLTGLDPTAIPLDSKEVMSLFQNTSALGVTPDDLMGCPLGALGIPEFGTDFAMNMLIDAQPKQFSDLVRISGLSHGTDVWLGNAETLIKEGTATISTAICCRDDIMIYLIGQGMDSELSFTIMEAVRKGKGLKPEWEKMMKEHDVPDWYIWSCKKIKYMFPKAHAAAYVMMAWRIAYCKVFYPLAYYAAFFSIRATAFDYEKMCLGKDRVEYHINDLKNREKTEKLSEKEKGTLRDLKIVQEMYARGFEFVPLDIYQAKAKHFQIIDGKLMASLSTIDGMGDKAAVCVEEEAKKGPFLSRDDFRNRTKVSKTVTDLMDELGMLDALPESNQYSLFDL